MISITSDHSKMRWLFMSVFWPLDKPDTPIQCATIEVRRKRKEDRSTPFTETMAPYQIGDI